MPPWKTSPSSPQRRAAATPAFFKLRDEGPAKATWVYIQGSNWWRAYGPGGVTKTQGVGSLPGWTLADTVPITQADAERLLQCRFHHSGITEDEWSRNKALREQRERTTVFRPCRWRIALVGAAPHLALIAAIVLAWGILWQIGPVSWSDRWFDLAIYGGGLVLAVVISSVSGPRDCRVEVTPTHVATFQEVAGRLPRRRHVETSQSMMLADIDRNRSARRTVWNRLRGRHRIYSVTGGHLVVLRAAFDPQDFRRLLGMLNIRE